jgi:hypothetical protein
MLVCRNANAVQYIPFVGKRYQPPAHLWDMYQGLRSKVGMAGWPLIETTCG